MDPWDFSFLWHVFQTCYPDVYNDMLNLCKCFLILIVCILTDNIHVMQSSEKIFPSSLF